MICSTVSTKISKTSENKVFWADHIVNECKNTNLGFLFSMNNKTNSKAWICILVSKGIWKELIRQIKSLQLLD